jgi:uncharacterized membrane protein
MNHDEPNLNGYERLVSALGGGALLRAGMRNGLWRRLLLGTGAMLLFRRAATGRSELYDRLGLSTTRATWREGLPIRRSITVGRSREAVYRTVRDFRQLPAIFDRLEDAEPRADGANRWRLREGPFSLVCVSELTAEEPGRRLAWVTRGGSRFRCDGEVTLVEAPGGRGTELRVVLNVAPPGGPAAMLLRPLLRTTAQVQVGTMLRQLKQWLETGEVATNAMQPPRRAEAPVRPLAASQPAPPMEVVR